MQVDPNQGTLVAQKGAEARLTEPHLYDMIFPIIALVLVIIIPTCVALWVMYKTVTDTELTDGEA
jgi:hypothetical protein